MADAGWGVEVGFEVGVGAKPAGCELASSGSDSAGRKAFLVNLKSAV